MSDEHLSGLTAEEIEALREDDGSEPTATTTEEPGNAEPEDKGAGGDDAGAAAPAGDAGAAAEPVDPAATAEAAPEPAAEAQPKQAPILVAEAPADADAQLAKIATDKDELLVKFDEGDITTAEYQKQLDALNKQEREIERAIDRHQLAIEMEKTRAKNEWEATCNRFMQQTHPEYGKDQALYGQLDEAVRAVANLSSMKDASFDDILERAHRVVVAGNPDKFGTAPAKPAAAKPAAIPKPGLPPSLHSVPSAEIADTAGGKFAALERLNGVELEAALAKMSDAERNQYLASA